MSFKWESGDFAWDTGKIFRSVILSLFRGVGPDFIFPFPVQIGHQNSILHEQNHVLNKSRFSFLEN